MFSVIAPRPRRPRGEGEFTVSTRRGKQFNTIVWSETDPLTGAGRDAVYIDGVDAAALGLGDGAAVRVRSLTGEMDGHLKVVSLPRGTLQVHWPEGNVLIADSPEDREPASHMPDYHSIVTLRGLD